MKRKAVAHPKFQRQPAAASQSNFAPEPAAQPAIQVSQFRPQPVQQSRPQTGGAVNSAHIHQPQQPPQQIQQPQQTQIAPVSHLAHSFSTQSLHKTRSELLRERREENRRVNEQYETKRFLGSSSSTGNLSLDPTEVASSLRLPANRIASKTSPELLQLLNDGVAAEGARSASVHRSAYKAFDSNDIQTASSRPKRSLGHSTSQIGPFLVDAEHLRFLPPQAAAAAMTSPMKNATLAQLQRQEQYLIQQHLAAGPAAMPFHSRSVNHDDFKPHQLASSRSQPQFTAHKSSLKITDGQSRTLPLFPLCLCTSCLLPLISNGTCRLEGAADLSEPFVFRCIATFAIAR